jgi:hypothetical protein
MSCSKEIKSISFAKIFHGRKCSAKVTSDGFIYAVDLVMVVTGLERDQAGLALRRVVRKNLLSFEMIERNTGGKGNAKTQLVRINDAIQLVMVLPGEMAKVVRLQIADIITKFIRGDETLVDQIHANAGSNSPIAQLARAFESVDVPVQNVPGVDNVQHLRADKHVDFEEEFRQFQKMHAEKKAEREEEIRHIRQLNADKQVFFEDEIRRIQQMRVEKKVEREEELLHISELQKRKRSEYEDNLEYERRMKQALIDNDYQRNQMWLEMERTKIRLEHDRQMICNPQYRSVYLETERLRLAQLPVAYAVPVPHNAPNQRNA